MGRSRVGFRVLGGIASRCIRAGMGVMEWKLDAGDCGRSLNKSCCRSDGGGGFCILVFNHGTSGDCAVGKNRTERDRGNSRSAIAWVGRIYFSQGDLGKECLFFYEGWKLGDWGAF